jgi:hypothetical protein
MGKHIQPMDIRPHIQTRELTRTQELIRTLEHIQTPAHIQTLVHIHTVGEMRNKLTQHCWHKVAEYSKFNENLIFICVACQQGDQSQCTMAIQQPGGCSVTQIQMSCPNQCQLCGQVNAFGRK